MCIDVLSNIIFDDPLVHVDARVRWVRRAIKESPREGVAGVLCHVIIEHRDDVIDAGLFQ